MIDNWRPLAYVFGVFCNIIGLIIYGRHVETDRDILIGAILITVGIISLLASYTKGG